MPNIKEIERPAWRKPPHTDIVFENAVHWTHVCAISAHECLNGDYQTSGSGHPLFKCISSSVKTPLLKTLRAAFHLLIEKWFWSLPLEVITDGAMAAAREVIGRGVPIIFCELRNLVHPIYWSSRQPCVSREVIVEPKFLLLSVQCPTNCTQRLFQMTLRSAMICNWLLTKPPSLPCPRTLMNRKNALTKSISLK